MNLIEIIQDELLSDDECTQKKTDRLITQFQNANESEKKIINDVLINLTGWSYDTLIQKCNDTDVDQYNYKEDYFYS